MDRSLHSAPARGIASSRWGNQDARSNLAVQPAANAGTIRLKKNAVKIVGAAGPLPNAPSKSSAPTPPTASSPVPAPVTAKPKEADGPVIDEMATKSTAPAAEPKSASPPVGTTEERDETESIIDSMFARLTTKEDLGSSRDKKSASFAGPDNKVFAFEDRRSLETAPKIVQSRAVDRPSGLSKSRFAEKTVPDSLPENKSEQVKTVDRSQESKETSTNASSQNDLEEEYMRKATEFVDALKGSKESTIDNVKLVSQKLRTSYVPDIELNSDEAEKLKKRFIFAITNYVNHVLKKDGEPLTPDFVKQTLKDNDGSFLSLCATLVEKTHLALENMNEVAGLCKAILDILPKAEPSVASSVKSSTLVASTTASEKTELDRNDPTASLKAWPTQEKRENAAGHRSCSLKGVSGVTSINQLQALVWGGRVESLSLPEPGSDFALVKFLTPEACQTYFEATVNGIEIAGAKTKVVFVEKTAGPNSVNDLTQNCIDGDVTRCVRAIGADDDWSDLVLLNLARGKAKVKCEIDRIKRGKTARGHNLVEFRFANIYDALTFRRQLMDDQDWEHCSIGYAPDPCETARGVHYKDEDEGGA